MSKDIVVVKRPGLVKCTRGANLVEYILLVGLVAIVCIAGFQKFGKAVNKKIVDETKQVKNI